MGLWSGVVNRSFTGMKRLEHVRKITLDELDELTTNMDDVEESTFPIVFIVENGDEKKSYEVGPHNVDDVMNMYGGYTHQYIGHLNNDEFELIDFNNIDIVSHIPTNKQIFIHRCNINENTKLYLDIEKSFTGKYREFDEEYYKELESKYGWKYGLYEPEKYIISKTCETLKESSWSFDIVKEIADWLCKPESLWKK